MLDGGGQHSLFAQWPRNNISMLLDSCGRARFVVIGCGRAKQAEKSKAIDLYTSQRFRLSRDLAVALGKGCAVLSGKHGLVQPGRITSPYNFELSAQPLEYQERWSRDVLVRLKKYSSSNDILLLAPPDYCSPILSANEASGSQFQIEAPFVTGDRAEAIRWLKWAKRTARRVEDLGQLYIAIAQMRKRGLTFKLGDLSRMDLPPRGVYLFLDTEEQNFLGTGARIVRVGTHAVSRNSKSSLRSRLRAHLGLSSGGGNHRASIFRLHIGKALLRSKLSNDEIPTWGVGQSATREIVYSECSLEEEVSSYLRKLEVCVLPIDDHPSKRSLRAKAESQLIALLTEDQVPIDRPTKQWLGEMSASETIRSCGLWNLRDVASVYRPSASGSVSDLISKGVL